MHSVGSTFAIRCLITVIYLEILVCRFVQPYQPGLVPDDTLLFVRRTYATDVSLYRMVESSTFYWKLTLETDKKDLQFCL